MKIGIDLDCCLNNMTEELINLYNFDYNDNLTIEDIKSWDIHEYVKCGTKIYEYLNKDDFFLKLSPQPYSQEVTKRLSKDHELYIVTATYPFNVYPKSQWLTRYFPHIPIDNLIVTQHKDLVNVDLLIDDACHNIVHFPRQVIIMDYAWNRDIDYIPRAKNWLEIENIINKMKEGN